MSSNDLLKQMKVLEKKVLKLKDKHEKIRKKMIKLDKKEVKILEKILRHNAEMSKLVSESKNIEEDLE